jgi:hypothetical protein
VERSNAGRSFVPYRVSPFVGCVLGRSIGMTSNARSRVERSSFNVTQEHDRFAITAALTGGLTADAFARGGGGGGGGGHGGGFGGGAHMGGGGRGGFVRNPTTLLGSPAPQMPAFENRILNGPMSQPTFRGMTGIGQ